MNLLSINKICHSGSSKIVDFSPYDVVIQDLHDFYLMVAIGSVNSTFFLYRFDGFESFDGTGSYLVAHTNSMRRLWHDHLGHVNYRYL